jgi:hypothetical protein
MPTDIFSHAQPSGTSAHSTHQSLADDTKQVVKEHADAIWNDAKETARTKFSDQQRHAASGLGDLASALRKAAHELDRDKQATAVRYAECTADGLERVAGTLRSKDLNTIMGDVESFAHRQPVAFFGAALAAGFLAVRFLKSSRSEPAYRGSVREFAARTSD